MPSARTRKQAPGVILHRQSVAILESAEDAQAMSSGLTNQLRGCGQAETCLPSFRCALGLALLVVGLATATAGGDADSNINPLSPIPLPIAKVTIPSITPVKIQSGGFVSALDQVKALEVPGSMPVLFLVAQRDASDDLVPWSLITPGHMRMFSINSQAAPDASDYLTHSHTLTQTAYAIDIPPKVAGQKPVVVLWENERDGVLTQATLEAIYKKIGIEVDPLTAPPLNEVAWNSYLLKAAQHLPDTPARLVVVAFHSNGFDQDLVSTTRLRILAGVEFIKSPKAPVADRDEAAHHEIAAKLIPPTTVSGVMLIVYNLVERKVEAIYNPSKLSGIVEDGFQAFALQNGAPAFLNTRTDVAEAFVSDRRRAAEAATGLPRCATAWRPQRYQPYAGETVVGCLASGRASGFLVC